MCYGTIAVLFRKGFLSRHTPVDLLLPRGCDPSARTRQDRTLSVQRTAIVAPQLYLFGFAIIIIIVRDSSIHRHQWQWYRRRFNTHTTKRNESRESEEEDRDRNPNATRLTGGLECNPSCLSTSSTLAHRHHHQATYSSCYSTTTTNNSSSTIPYCPWSTLGYFIGVNNLSYRILFRNIEIYSLT